MTINNDIKNKDSIPVVSEVVASLLADGMRFTLESVVVKLTLVAAVVVLPTSKRTASVSVNRV